MQSDNPLLFNLADLIQREEMLRSAAKTLLDEADRIRAECNRRAAPPSRRAAQPETNKPGTPSPAE